MILVENVTEIYPARRNEQTTETQPPEKEGKSKLFQMVESNITLSSNYFKIIVFVNVILFQIVLLMTVYTANTSASSHLNTKGEYGTIAPITMHIMITVGGVPRR